MTPDTSTARAAILARIREHLQQGGLRNDRHAAGEAAVTDAGHADVIDGGHAANLDAGDSSALAASIAAGYAALPRAYRRHGTQGPEACRELFLERLRDYDSEIVETDAAHVAAAIAVLLARDGERRLLLPASLPALWCPDRTAQGAVQELELLRDCATAPLALADVETAPAVLTGCTVAIAETGSIVLAHGDGEAGDMCGRRALSLLPDHHLCVIRADQIVETVSEGLAALQPAGSQPITTISGPSATSDIEMTRIRGVHGPRRLTVLLLTA